MARPRRMGPRKGRKMKRTFGKRVRKVVDRMSETHFIQKAADSFVVGNFPAVYTHRLDYSFFAPVKGTGVNQFEGNKYTVLGYQIMGTLTVDADAHALASTRLHLVELKREVPYPYTSNADGQPNDTLTEYIVQGRNLNSPAPAAAGTLVLWQSDADKQVYPTQALQRLPVFGFNAGLLPGVRRKKTWLLDAQAPSGTMNRYMKRFSLFIPCKKTITQGTISQAAAAASYFRNPTYLMFETCRTGTPDSAVANPAVTGVTVTYSIRMKYRDL